MRAERKLQEFLEMLKEIRVEGIKINCWKPKIAVVSKNSISCQLRTADAPKNVLKFKYKCLREKNVISKFERDLEE